MNDQSNEPTPVDNEELAVLFHRASRMMARAYHRGAHAQHAQERVFSIIREHGSMRQGYLLDILDVRSSSLSEVLGKLESSGLITRERDAQDKRGFIISVKPGAHPAFWDQPDGLRKDVGAFFACLGQEERHQLGDLLHKLIQSLEKDERLARDASPAPGRPMPGCGHGHGHGCHGAFGRLHHGRRRGGK